MGYHYQSSEDKKRIKKRGNTVKTRQGFVSNSSSSSFIVGVGKVKSLDAFHKWAKKNKVTIGTENYSDVRLKTTSDILKADGWDFGVRGETVYVEEPVNNGGEVSCDFDPAGDDFYCIVCIGNNEGDDQFWNGHDMDYDIGQDYFYGDQSAVLEMLESGDLLEGVSSNFGAARNG